MGPKPSLPPCGYIVVYLGLASEVLSALQDEARSRNYTPVFQEVGGDSDDQFREQSRVVRTSGAVGELKRALKAITACLDPGWLPSVFSFMRSRPGGPEQESHQDYPTSVIDAANSKGRVPASMVCALEEGTQLRVFDGCVATKDDAKARVLSIPVGFCVIFRGDLIHNGMPYETTNHRIHCYLSYRGLAWEPDIVSSVLPRHYECQYCDLKLDQSNLMRQHRRYCKKNPKAQKNEETRRAPTKRQGPWSCNICGDSYDVDSSYRTHVSRGHKHIKTALGKGTQS